MSARQPSPSDRIGRALPALSLMLYGLCLLAPAYKVDGSGSGGAYPGWVTLLLGPIGLLGGHISWLANPALCYSWVMLSRRNYPAASTSASIALVAALTFPFYSTVPVGGSGNFSFSAQYGYYMWLASIVLALASGMAGGAGRASVGQASE